MKKFVWPAALATALASAWVGAQSHVTPSDSEVRTPSHVYESVFQGYQPMTDDKPVPWRQANEQMGALRGHRDHINSSEPARKVEDGQTKEPRSSSGIEQPRATAPETAREASGHAH